MAEKMNKEGFDKILQDFFQGEDARLVDKLGNTCQRHALRALRDKQVQGAMFDHLSNGTEEFVGVECRLGIPENVYIVFEFRCVLPRICICPPKFLVIMDAFSGHVLKIQDPYVECSIVENM